MMMVVGIRVGDKGGGDEGGWWVVVTDAAKRGLLLDTALTTEACLIERLV